MNKELEAAAAALQAEVLRPMPSRNPRSLDERAREAFLNSVLGLGGTAKTKKYQAMRRKVDALCAEHSLSFTDVLIGLIDEATAARGRR